jgi:predicted DNA-binding transcriptional regulator AlpA
VDERVDLAHPARWVDASEVAVYLGTDRDWVYRHGLELDGPRARKRTEGTVALQAQPRRCGARRLSGATGSLPR